MRTAILMLALTLFSAPQANAQTTYVLVDRSSSISKKETNAAVVFAQEYLKPLADDASVSLTYFGGDNGGDCKTPVKIEPAIGKSQISVAPPTASGSTPIAAALKAVVPLAAKNAGEVFLVTDGREGCGVSLCAAVKDLRAEYTNVPITFKTVGEEQRDLDARDDLGCLSAITSEDVFSSTVTVPTVEKPNAPRQPTFWERWYWLWDFILFATAAIVFSFRFGHRSVLLEQLIKGHKEPKPAAAADQTDPANAAVVAIDGSPQTAANVAAPVTQNTDSPKTIEQQLEAGEKRPFWKHMDFIIFAAASVFLLFLMFGWGDFFEHAQAAAWQVVNSDFANAFAVLELSIIGFAGLEFWRYTQLKREHAVVSGALERAVAAEVRRRKEVLFEAYGRQRKSVQRVTFSTPWDWRLTKADRDNLVVVLKGLLGRAVNPASTADDVTDAQLNDLRRYAPTFGGWDMQKFAAQLLEDERIPEDVPRDIEEFLDKLVRFRQPDAARAVLTRLAAHFQPPPDQANISAPPAG